MRVIRFVGANMKDVFDQVREELGAEALILSTHEVPGGIEVSAAVEPAPEQEATVEERADEFTPFATPLRATGLRPEDPASPRGRHSGYGAGRKARFVAQRLDRDRRLALEEWVEQLGPETTRAGLLALGLPVQAAERLSTWVGAPVLAEDEVAELADLVGVDALPASLPDGRFAIIGPPGAGKTTLISKLIVNHVLHFGSEDCALITLDTQRPGAVDQLRRIADLVGVDISVAQDAVDLERRLAAWSDRSLVLIDTPGIALADVATSAVLAAISAQQDEISTVLVTPGFYSDRHQARVFGCFDEHAHRVCASFVDDCDGIAELATQTIRYGKKLCWVSEGPAIPDDLSQPTAQYMRYELLAALSQLISRQTTPSMMPVQSRDSMTSFLSGAVGATPTSELTGVSQ